MKDNQHLIEEIAQKQAEIGEDLQSYIDSGGGDGTYGFELIQAKNMKLGSLIEQLQQEQSSLASDIESLSEIEKGEIKND